MPTPRRPTSLKMLTIILSKTHGIPFLNPLFSLRQVAMSHVQDSTHRTYATWLAAWEIVFLACSPVTAVEHGARRPARKSYILCFHLIWWGKGLLEFGKPRRCRDEVSPRRRPFSRHTPNPQLLNSSLGCKQIGWLPTTNTSQPCYTYLWSFSFKNYSTAQNAFLFHNWTAGLILPLATAIMSFFEGKVAVRLRAHTHTQ